ncbi:hypothetical protein NDU88_002525 [Pleurodeles waltl]|uniref:Uncharacterized protein n=1 Tax=Pleurodeles waltl TaxID=8319 RepID=A0AAV7WSL5_PLEWA|nr:hypothetical protein NDU88_002525 [Pleurodeles waltl]
MSPTWRAGAVPSSDGPGSTTGSSPSPDWLVGEEVPDRFLSVPGCVCLFRLLQQPDLLPGRGAAGAAWPAAKPHVQPGKGERPPAEERVAAPCLCQPAGESVCSAPVAVWVRAPPPALPRTPHYLF